MTPRRLFCTFRKNTILLGTHEQHSQWSFWRPLKKLCNIKIQKRKYCVACWKEIINQEKNKIKCLRKQLMQNNWVKWIKLDKWKNGEKKGIEEEFLFWSQWECVWKELDYTAMSQGCVRKYHPDASYWTTLGSPVGREEKREEKRQNLVTFERSMCEVWWGLLEWLNVLSKLMSVEFGKPLMLFYYTLDICAYPYQTKW